MKQRIIQITTFTLFLLPLFIILVSPAFSTHALGLDEPVVRSASGPSTAKFYSMGGLYDGWILESGELTGVGGFMNTASGAMVLGDDVADRQYRGIVTFATSIASTSEILYAALYLTGSGGSVGINPFTFGDLKADVKRDYFGTSKYMQLADFQASANLSNAGSQTFCTVTVNVKCVLALTYPTFQYIRTSLSFTQFRLRFAPDDNDNMAADYYRIFSGDVTTLTSRPMLVVRYYP